MASQEYVIHRDLHCWEAEFVRRYYAGEWEYYFRINVKALPDIQLETGSKSLSRSVRWTRCPSHVTVAKWHISPRVWHGHRR